MNTLPISKTLRTLMFLGPILCAVAGAGGALAVTKAKVEENAQDLKETRRKMEEDSRDTRRKMEKLDSAREEGRIQITEVQSDLKNVKEGIDRIERKLGTK